MKNIKAIGLLLLALLTGLAAAVYAITKSNTFFAGAQGW